MHTCTRVNDLLKRVPSNLWKNKFVDSRSSFAPFKLRSLSSRREFINILEALKKCCENLSLRRIRKVLHTFYLVLLFMKQADERKKHDSVMNAGKRARNLNHSIGTQVFFYIWYQWIPFVKKTMAHFLKIVFIPIFIAHLRIQKDWNNFKIKKFDQC